jgi:hypothetical protein
VAPQPSGSGVLQADAVSQNDGGKSFNAKDEQLHIYKAEQRKSDDDNLLKSLNPRGQPSENVVPVQD